MRLWVFFCGLALAATSSFGGSVLAAEIKVLSSNAARTLMEEIELQYVTTLSAGIGAAGTAPDTVKALIRYLATPEAAEVIRAKGLEPG